MGSHLRGRESGAHGEGRGSGTAGTGRRNGRGAPSGTRENEGSTGEYDGESGATGENGATGEGSPAARKTPVRRRLGGIEPRRTGVFVLCAGTATRRTATRPARRVSAR